MTTAAAGLTHRLVRSPRAASTWSSRATGPLVLLLHGFPEGWYSWRHQLPALAAAGYRAVAIDLRGYGRSSRPAEVAAYRIGDFVEDNLAVVEALGERQAVIAGHDVGSVIAADSALIRPDVFRAVALLSVPLHADGRPAAQRRLHAAGAAGTRVLRQLLPAAGPGRGRDRAGRARLAPRLLRVAVRRHHARPGRAPWALIRAGHAMRERFPDAQPDWLSDADLDVVAAEFERTGLTGALNRDRSSDQDWADLAGYASAPITQPSLFVAGALDAAVVTLAGAIAAFPTTMAGIRGSHLVDGAGHWIQQERPGEVSALLTRWLDSLPN